MATLKINKTTRTTKYRKSTPKKINKVEEDVNFVVSIWGINNA